MLSSYAEARLREEAWWRINQKSIAETLLALHLLMHAHISELLEKVND